MEQLNDNGKEHDDGDQDNIDRDDECNLPWLGFGGSPQIRGARLNPLPQFQCHLIATNLRFRKPAK